MSRRAALCVAFFLLVVMLPVAPAGAGGFCHEGGNTQEETTQVDMKGNCFYPTVTHIDVGDKVTWTNHDGENHIILGVGGSWGTPEVSPDGATAVRFDEPGTYPYWCHIHLGMVGAVVVGDGRAVDTSTGAEGSGPAATLVSVDEPASTEDSATTTGDEPAAESTEPAAQVEGIDWSALAVAASLIAAVAAALIFGPVSARRRSLSALVTKKLG